MRGSRTAVRRHRRAGLLASFVPAVLLVVVLTGCAPGAATSTAPSPSGSTATPSSPAAPAPTGSAPSAPSLHPDGSAKDNLPYFTAIVAKVWASGERASNRAYIDAMAAAGFARADMQMTADTTTVDNPAESFQFSVRWGSTECLVGQVGPSTGDPVTAVLPQLAGGRCLIGSTPPVGG
ncbi:DUF6993 domain-containing protein [Microbacterium sp. 22242]|uniref:DUF6993 domain-containing protein n=1 Tax=Microbacterium sp. 22242 TaxID=3453896 RepID=UPI003F8414D3